MGKIKYEITINSEASFEAVKAFLLDHFQDFTLKEEDKEYKSI